MDRELLLEQLRDRYMANPEESIELLIEFLERAVENRGSEVFANGVIELLSLVPEAQEGLFDDEDMINCVGEE